MTDYIKLVESQWHYLCFYNDKVTCDIKSKYELLTLHCLFYSNTSTYRLFHSKTSTHRLFHSKTSTHCLFHSKSTHRLFHSKTSTHRLFHSNSSTHRLLHSKTSTHRYSTPTFQNSLTILFQQLNSQTIPSCQLPFKPHHSRTLL